MRAVGQLWDGYLKAVTSLDESGSSSKRMGGVGAALGGFSDDQVMQAIEARRSGQDGPPQRKIKEAEFELLTCGQPTIGKNEHDSVFYAEEYPQVGTGTDRADEAPATRGDRPPPARGHGPGRLHAVRLHLAGHRRRVRPQPPARAGWASTRTGSPPARTRARACSSSSTRTRSTSGSRGRRSGPRPTAWNAASGTGAMSETSRAGQFFGAAVRHAPLPVPHADQRDLAGVRLSRPRPSRNGSTPTRTRATASCSTRPAPTPTAPSAAWPAPPGRSITT